MYEIYFIFFVVGAISGWLILNWIWIKFLSYTVATVEEAKKHYPKQ